MSFSWNFSRTINYLVISLVLLMAATSLPAADKPVVFVSVVPQKYLLNQIAGDLVEIQVMVRPGYSPATYEPGPRQIRLLAKADIYFRAGVPFETAWMERIKAVNPEMKVVDARSGVELRKLEDHHHEQENHQLKMAFRHDHDHDKNLIHPENIHQGLDPHIWTSPRIALRMGEQLLQELSARYPQHREIFAENHRHLQQELETLDKELSELFADFTDLKFMVFHPSWGYFADAYGLTQIPIESEGKEPGARALTALIRQARRDGVKTIFIQPQFDQRIARQVAEAIDGKVVAIDPLAENYLENLRHVAGLIAGLTDE